MGTERQGHADRREFPRMAQAISELIRKCNPPTQQEFARRVGVQQSVVSMWVNGTIPRPATRAQLCEVLGIEREEFEARARGYSLDPRSGKNDLPGPSIPLVGVAPAGTMGWHCETGPTTDDAPDRVTVPWLPHGKGYFACRIDGRSMEPVLHENWIAFFRWLDPYQDQPEEIEDGAIVYIHASADSKRPDECCVAYWSFDPDTRNVTLTKASKKFAEWREVLPFEHIQQVAKFEGTRPKLM